MVYVIVAADLAVAAWMLWYARVRERRNRSQVAVVGLMLVVCAVALVTFTVTHRTTVIVRNPPPPPPSLPAGQQQ